MFSNNFFAETLQFCQKCEELCTSKAPDVFFSENIPYFFGYKAEIFSFQNNPKDLDPSWKTDLDLCDCLGRVKLVL